MNSPDGPSDSRSQPPADSGHGGRRSGPSSSPSPRVHLLPQGTGRFGMLLFLAALAMLFAASLLAFIIIRLTSENAPPAQSMTLPWPLWISTAVILLSSFTMHRALQNVQAERQTRFRNMMTLTLGLAGIFLMVQTPSMIELVQEFSARMPEFQEQQRQAREAVSAAGGNTAGVEFPALPLQAWLFFLILVHAAHLLGGVIPLAVITTKAHRGGYDHESCGPVQYITMYWHFLDAVWIIMFITLMIAV